MLLSNKFMKRKKDHNKEIFDFLNNVLLSLDDKKNNEHIFKECILTYNSIYETKFNPDEIYETFRKKNNKM